MRMSPARGRVLIGLLGVWLAACGSPPPPAAPAPAGPSATPSPMPEETLPPDVVRCGVDDAPVPISAATASPDRRLALVGQPLGLVAMAEPSPQRAMLPTVTLSPDADGVGLSRGDLIDLFVACADQAQPADAGEIALSVAFGSSGAPKTSRPLVPEKGPGPSPFARCLAERACRFPVSAAVAGKTLTTRIRTTISPPVFRGQVMASVSFVPTGPRDQAPTKPVQARMTLLQKLAQEAGMVCAKRLPPADDVFLMAPVVLEAGKPKAFGFQPSVDHGEILRTCVDAELVAPFAKLEPAPKLGALLNISLQITAEPAARVAPPD